MPSHYPTRRTQNCPDGFEHQMSNGTWMCGRTHQHNQTRGFADDLGFDNFDPDRRFGDDLGYDDFDPDRNGRNLRQQQGNQTRGFGDDIGFDDFNPDRNFGDDLGFDDFDPDRKGGSMKRHLNRNQFATGGNMGRNTRGFGDDIGFDDFEPDGGNIIINVGEKGSPNLSKVPAKYKNDVKNLISYYQNPNGYRWEPPKSCSACGGGVGYNGCAGICVNGSYKKKKWKFEVSWTFGRGGKIKKKNQGGILQGPSHEQGGIPAIVGGNTPVELEGGEYIINAQTVNAVGQEFLDQLNSTQTTYHQGGYGAGQLPPPSQFKNGGRVVRRNKRTRPIPTRRKGGKIKKMAHGGMHNSCPAGMTMGANGGCIPMSNGYKKGGVVNRKGRKPRKMAHGGMHNSCPAGMTMQNGQCVSMGSNMGSGYRRGGKPRPRKRLQEGGLITRARNTVASNVKNKQRPTIFKSMNNLSKGEVGSNIVGVNTRISSGGPAGIKAHKHTIVTSPDGKSGHTSTERGHSHKVVNGVLSVECTPELGCHSHNF